MKQTVDRNYGIDLLRIISMYMVCVLHMLGRGGILERTNTSIIAGAITLSFDVITFCAVDCFALISGYVGVKSKYKINNCFRLWYIVIFYSVIITLIFTLFVDISLKQIIISFFPTINGTYWYWTAYAIMFFFIPFMNDILLNYNEIKLLNLLYIAFICFCMIPIIPFIPKSRVSAPLDGGLSPFWLMHLYMIGGYIRVFESKKLNYNNYSMDFNKGKDKFKYYFENILLCRIKFKQLIILYFIVIFITWIARGILPMIAIKYTGSDQEFKRILSYNSPTIFMTAIILLHFFKEKKYNIPIKQIIKFISPLAFSVYLIQCHPCIWNYVLPKVFLWVDNVPLYLLPITIIIGSILFFLSCIAIDIIRYYLWQLGGLILKSH